MVAILNYAEDNGWTFTKASGRAHIFGMLLCRRDDRTGCRFRVYSTQLPAVQKIIRDGFVVLSTAVLIEGAIA